MTIIKRAIQDEINEMNHEPDTYYPGMKGIRYPEISWENVYFRALEYLEEHVDIDSLPDDISLSPKQIIESEMERMKDSEWVQRVLSDARTGAEDRARLEEDPYKEFGISKHDF